jgi:predicted O-methyltransferase YrrM
MSNAVAGGGLILSNLAFSKQGTRAVNLRTIIGLTASWLCETAYTQGSKTALIYII